MHDYHTDPTTYNMRALLLADMSSKLYLSVVNNGDDVPEVLDTEMSITLRGEMKLDPRSVIKTRQILQLSSLSKSNNLAHCSCYKMVFKISAALVALFAAANAATVKRVACPDGKNFATNEAVSISIDKIACIFSILFFTVLPVLFPSRRLAGKPFRQRMW